MSFTSWLQVWCTFLRRDFPSGETIKRASSRMNFSLPYLPMTSSDFRKRFLLVREIKWPKSSTRSHPSFGYRTSLTSSFFYPPFPYFLNNFESWQNLCEFCGFLWLLDLSKEINVRWIGISQLTRVESPLSWTLQIGATFQENRAQTAWNTMELVTDSCITCSGRSPTLIKNTPDPKQWRIWYWDFSNLLIFSPKEKMTKFSHFIFI